MKIIRFVDKTIPVETITKTTTPSIKITDRISPTLYSEFTNLNFAGVYKIGSKTDSRDCYIGSCYNITLKITHHLNLLYRGVHHSKELQDWVIKNGIENIDISVLAFTSSNPDEFEGIEQYYLNKIKPRFNSIINKRNVKIEYRDAIHRRYCNTNIKNEFGNSIVSNFSAICEHKVMRVAASQYEEDLKKKRRTPTIIIDMDDYSSVIRGEMVKVKKSIEAPKQEEFVIRKAFFSK